MFPPAQRSLGNSSTYGRPRANQSFLGRVQNLKKNFNKKFWALYKKSKKFLWIASTGAIFLAIPITFGILFEQEIEMQRIAKSREMSGFYAPEGPAPRM